jgi:hydroxymethylglutaryl-CoA reductase (NADPH)
MADDQRARVAVPRDRDDDTSEVAAAGRRDFVREQTGVDLHHVGSYDFDPAVTAGNIESFLGVAQVPLGLAGPLLVDGEHAQGEFYVPLATAEGTLVASYNRGMRVLHESGGARTTVVADRMQRGPSFLFPSSREARDFCAQLDTDFDGLAAAAATTTSTGRLLDIDRWVVGRRVYTRFNYSTGDAAGQNMTGKATLAACEWLRPRVAAMESYILESNTATDKKPSLANTMLTRGKRVVAEVTVPAAVIEQRLHTTAQAMFDARQASIHGGLLVGSFGNGSHPANGVTALFLATGQDAANVIESASTLNLTEVRPNGDLYYSVTMQSLIVATYGGGTGLPSQRECLELLGCYGSGRVRKFAEIVAATVLAGELSLGAAVVAGDWVSSHDTYGRNRP